MASLATLLSIALIVAVIAPHSVAATTYSVAVPVHPFSASCISETRLDPGCSGVGDEWSSLANALNVDESYTDVVLQQELDCSEQLTCKGWLTPQDMSSWTTVTVNAVSVSFGWSFPSSTRVSIGLTDLQGNPSAFFAEEDVILGAGTDLELMHSSLYGMTEFPISDLNQSFGVYARLQRRVGSSADAFRLDGFILQLEASGDATISGVSPREDVLPGQDITIAGAFFDTRMIGRVVLCHFRSAPFGDVLASSPVTSITSTEVVCSVPVALGDDPDVFDVTVTLDLAQDDISPGTTLYFRQAEADVPADDEPNDKPKAAFDVPLPVLAASGAGVAVLGIAGAVVMMRRNSRGGASDGDTVDGKSATSLSLSTAVGASASATGTTTATTAATASGVSASGARGNSTHDTAAVAGAAGAGRRPSKQRRPSHKGRVQRGTSTPLRPAAGKKGAAFETTPVSAFGPARSSMRTAYSVTSEQAPYFES